MATLFQETSSAVQQNFSAQATFIAANEEDAIRDLNEYKEELTSEIGNEESKMVADLNDYQEGVIENFEKKTQEMDATITAIIGGSDNSIVDTLVDLKNFIQDNEDAIATSLKSSKDELKNQREESLTIYGGKDEFDAGIGAGMTSLPTDSYE